MGVAAKCVEGYEDPQHTTQVPQMTDNMSFSVTNVELDHVLQESYCQLSLKDEICLCFKEMIEMMNYYHWVVIVHELESPEL